MTNVVKLGFFGFENTGKEHEGFKQFLGVNEHIVFAFKGVRDELVFTNKRAIVLNIQGLTGRKKEFRFFHYNKLNNYAIESSGTFDLDSEVKFVIGSTQYEFELGKGVNVFAIAQLLSETV